MNRVVSADGTEIAWQSRGTGPALVLIVGAFCDSSTTRGLTDLLESRFTVYEYDRRGRGQSGDGADYAPERETEDLMALLGEIDQEGGPFVYGHSSGAMIALDAAAAGAPVPGVAAFEPPFTSPDGRPRDDLLLSVEGALADGDLDGAAKAFLIGSGAPPHAVEGISRSPGWPGMRALAPTLAYDLRLSNGGVVPAERYSAIATDVTVLWGGSSPEWASSAATRVASAITGARTLEVPGQTHAVAHEPIAAILSDVFLGENAPPAS